MRYGTAAMRASAIVSLLLTGCASAWAASDTRVVQAVRQDNKQAVRAALKQGADVNGRLGDGSTALHWAVHRGDRDLVSELLGAGAAVNATNDLGVPPLWVACNTGNSMLVAELLRAGANPNLRPSTGGTCLMRAVQKASVDIVRQLLAHGADVNASEQLRGQTALMWAAAGRQPALVRLMVDAGANVNARSRGRARFVAECCFDNNLGVPSDGVEMTRGGLTPLIYAAMVGDVESGQILVGAGARVDDSASNGASALEIAALAGHGAFAAMLLDRSADPNLAGAGFTALHAAVLRGDVPLIQHLLAGGADINARLARGTPTRRDGPDLAFDKRMKGATPFVLAARHLEVEVMRVLAAKGANPRLAMNDGTTALVAAGMGGDATAAKRTKREALTLDAIKIALELKADPNEVNQTGDTALHGVAAQGFDTVIQLLAAHGAAMSPKNRNNQTPLAIVLAGRPLPKGAFSLDEFVSRPDFDRPRTANLLRQLGAKE